MAILNKVEDSPMLLFYCPGCEEPHQIDSSRWEFNKDYAKPTFSPSYLVWLDANPKADPNANGGKYYNGSRCHSFIREGQIQFLDDCTHDLAGQTVDMVDLNYA